MYQELMRVYEKHFKKEWDLTGYRGPVLEGENTAYAELWLAKEIKKVNNERGDRQCKRIEQKSCISSTQQEK
jgi:hypothetical protein